jgi:predicted nucleic acid-binding protein
LAQPDVGVVVLDEAEAKAVGRLCGISGHSDVVDVHVALHATEHGHHVVTSDPDDIRVVNPSLPLVVV